MDKDVLEQIHLPRELTTALKACPNIIIPASRAQLLEAALGGPDNDFFEVAYEVPNRGRVVEATVARCKNGASVNYIEAYMRRRDPEAMVIADDKPSDKRRFADRFADTLGADFDPIRDETFAWFAEQESLLVLPFMSGSDALGYPSILIAPANAGFFVAGLADLQGFIPRDELPEHFTPVGALYVAPPFRHTHFEGRQVVVHNRRDDLHELFCYNLYPGPSAKKGVYGILLTRGEAEGWVTLHSSSVRLITPYDNEFVILHEGASGGGKSEMTQAVHRENDGRVMLAENIVNGEQLFIELVDTCELHPISDDMSEAHPRHQGHSGKLVIEDAEDGWFWRVDHLTEYGTEPEIERLVINPPEPLIFLNLDGKPGATVLVWEPTEDEPGKPCPNPRVIMPRAFVPNTVSDPVEVDVRSFGVRTPPCTREEPNYGIIGMLHVLPRALAWLWRLVAPRGHANPSIVATAGLTSEGVGSYWPFATGLMVTHANLLLKQIAETPNTRYVLIPNQHIGAYRVGFKAEWIDREYIARRGSVRFREDQLIEARCPLLGWTIESLKVNGQRIPRSLLCVQEQPEVGTTGYDAGAEILTQFFAKELDRFYTDDLHPLGRRIIDAFRRGASTAEYEQMMLTMKELPDG